MTGVDLIATTSAFVGLGILAGFTHLKLLSWQIRALTGTMRSLGNLAVLPTRAGTTIAALTLAATHGALPLMAMLAGFLLIRTVLVRRPEIFVP